MAIEQQSAAVGAVGEKGVGVLSRSQTTRLPDRAATAALYMTHPDRRLSVREPAIADAQLRRDSTATANWRLDLSHASASAALAHTRSKPIEVWRPKAQPAAERAAFHARDFPAPDAIYVAKPTPESHLAAASAIRDRRSIISNPPAPLEMEPEQLADLQRRASQREKALLAATGAYNPSRKRAGTAPSKPSASVSQRPLAASAAGASREAAAAEPLEPTTIVDDFPPSVEASRIQHVTNTDPQLYTSHPPVEGEEEQRKKNVQQAAVVSMARDMYDITEAKGEAGGKPSPAVSAAQRGQTRMQPRKAPNQRDPAAVKQAIGLQEAAQKRAQEKLALMHNEAAAFQDYYGTAPQPARGLGSRKRRTSSDPDVEQSKEIRKQMSSLRFKLNTVDEKRERDRHLLMEAARRNVDAAIHDMEKKVYYDTGRAPSSLQREWELEAEQRMKKEQQESVEQQQQQQPDKVNIGAEQFVNMSDVEATARSRVQPTLDEINENADEYQDKLEADRAREMEERLDQERQKGLQSTQRQRESDLKAEEKRLNDHLKHENKEGKTEKSRLFGKRSKRSSKGAEPATEKAEATGAAGGKTTGAAKDTEAADAAKDTETAGAAKDTETTGDTETAGAAKDTETTGAAEDTEIAGAAGGAGATGATVAPAPVAAVEAPADEGPSSGEEIPEMYPSQGVEGENELVTAPPQEQKVTPKSESKLRNWFRKSRGSRRSSVPDEPQPKEERAPREPDRRASAAEDAAVRVQEDSRGAALASHPITGEELDEMQRRRSVASTTEENAGQSVAKDSSGDQRRSSFFRRSNLKKMVSRNGHEPKTNGAPEQTEGTAAAAATGDAPASPSILHRASIPEREDLRDYAAEQGLPVPPAGIGKQTSHGTRESRFSEDL